MRHIYVASPNPLLAYLLSLAYKTSWLRVVDEDDVAGDLQFLDVLPGDLPEETVFGLGYLLVSAMKSIVEFLRHLVKVRGCLNDVPACIDTKFVQQRDHSVQYLRYASTIECGVDVLNDLALQSRSDQPQLFNVALPDYRSVVIYAKLARFSISRISDDLRPSKV